MRMFLPALASVLVTASVFAGPPPSPGKGVKPPPTLALSAPLEFSPHREIAKLGGLRLSAFGKTARPVSAEIPQMTISLSERSPGTSVELLKPNSVTFGADAPRAAFLSTTERTLMPERPRVEVRFPVARANLYVADCPISGINGGHHRVEFAANTPGSRFAVVDAQNESARLGRFLVTHLAERDGALRITLQGHIVDGEEYGWGFHGCRVTVFPYA